MKESQVQRQIIDGLRQRGAFVITTHDAKHKPVCPGITDIVAVFPGRVLFVECKKPGGMVSEYQREFISEMRARGHEAFVTDGWDDCERHL